MVQEKQKDRLFDNRLRKIENRLRKLEVLFLRNAKGDKKLKKEMDILEKEEKIIETEQKKLEAEETEILDEIKRFEAEERWRMELQYNCKAKVMEEENKISCQKTGKGCEMKICPVWKKR